MKYLSINEPHLLTDLLMWGSPPSSWTPLSWQALCIHSWAPGWPLAAYEIAGHSFVLLAASGSSSLKGNQVSFPQDWRNLRPHTFPGTPSAGTFLEAFTGATHGPLPAPHGLECPGASNTYFRASLRGEKGAQVPGGFSPLWIPISFGDPPNK